MNILLIQPPHPPAPVDGDNLLANDAQPLSPPWDLMCLRAYLFERTRHIGHLLDGRLYSDLEKNLVEAVTVIPAPRLAVINTSTVGLGQSSAVMEIIKRHFPDTRTVVMGQHPSHFPEHAILSREDYALCGDPEPILRNLLDYMDVPQRLERIPGLIYRGRENPGAYWLSSLKGLSLPSWDGTFWRAYAKDSGSGIVRAEARLSRGHSRLPADRAHGQSGEPLREWGFDQMALSVQKSLGAGVNEIFLTDPPGFWTLERLRRWCAALARCHNMQSWGLQLLPAMLSEEIVNLLKENQCRRIEFLIPSCDMEIMERYHCTVNPKDLAHTLHMLNHAGIKPHLQFWLGGPEESRGETDRVLKAIRAIGYCSYSLHPFPFHTDSPLYAQLEDPDLAPPLETWIQWARDPWLVQRPVPLYGGQPRADQITREATRIQATIHRSPGHVLKKLAHRLSAQNWIEVMEQKAAALLSRARSSE